MTALLRFGDLLAESWSGESTGEVGREDRDRPGSSSKEGEFYAAVAFVAIL
jgi:hypothetical protein